MGRPTSSLVATFTIDLKDRSGITVEKGLKLGLWEKGDKVYTNCFAFSVTDPGDSKTSKLADKLFDKYFDKLIYPAVQAFRFILPRHRVNVGITLSGHMPYEWAKEKTYTGEYITYIKYLPKFETYHDAYYVARALFNQTNVNEVQANLARMVSADYIELDYPDIKRNYRNACLLGKALMDNGHFKAEENHLVVDDPVAMKYFFGVKKDNDFIHQLWWRSHHNGEKIIHDISPVVKIEEIDDEESFDQLVATSDTCSSDVYLAEEGIFDSFFNGKGGI